MVSTARIPTALALHGLTPSLLVLALATAAPGRAEATAKKAVPPAAPKSILVLDLVATDVPAGAPRLLSSLLADSVAKRSGMKTLAQEDLRRVMQLESEKAALGCDTSTCLADMANAMGVDYVLFGDVGKLGNAFIVTLRLYDSKRSDTVSRQTAQAPTIDALRDSLDASVGALLLPLGIAPGAAASAGAAGPLFWPGVVCASVGGVGALALGAWALGIDAQLADARAPGASKAFAYDAGPFVLGGAGASALVALVGGGLIAASLPGEG